MRWSIYNQSLVRRGEIILGFDVINNWDIELKEMNKDKVGLGAISLPQYFSSFTCLDMPRHTFICHTNRQTEGIAQGHAHRKVPSIPDYSTISRRINRLDIKIKDVDTKNKDIEDHYIVIAINR